VRIACHPWVDWFKLARRIHELRQRFRATPEVEQDLPMKTLEHGSVEVVQWRGGGRGEQPECRLWIPGSVLGGRRLYPPACPLARAGSECRGTLEEGGGRGESAAGARTLGRSLEVGRDGFRRARRPSALYARRAGQDRARHR
jgi:hypothetical protein